METQSIVIEFNNCSCIDGEINVEVYPLNKDSIEKNVPDGIQPANYRIGRLSNLGYSIIYVGRVDDRQDRGLKDRMIEHLDDFEGNCYFEWNETTSILDAYKKECTDYHCWSLLGTLENSIHPRKPSSSIFTICPICGQ